VVTRVAWAQTPSEPQAPPSQPDQGAVPGGGAGAARTPPANAPEAAGPVTPPKLVHFEQAPYPKEAEEAKLEADVVLRLDIDKDGHVSAVSVAEPAGHGFDEAATAAAQKFLFEPARRGGVPIPVRILYKYSFTLTPVPTEEPPPFVPDDGRFDADLIISWRAARAWAARSGRRT